MQLPQPPEYGLPEESELFGAVLDPDEELFAAAAAAAWAFATASAAAFASAAASSALYCFCVAESLIKGGSEDARLQQMALDSIDAYARLGGRCRPGADAALNQAGLGRFIGRMEKEGNPASASLNRVLGKRQAEIFFRTAVMSRGHRCPAGRVLMVHWYCRYRRR